MRTSTSVVAALLLVLGLGAPATARPYDVTWRDVADLPGDGQVLAVDQATGDVLAMTSPFQDSQVVRRLDGRTGEVEWVTEVTGDPTRIAVDPTDGRVVLAGAYQGPLRLLVLSAGGQVLQDLTTDIVVRSIVDLEIDPASGLACTLGSQGRKDTEKLWMTSCWERSGALRFSQAWEPPDGKSQPNELVIDPVGSRVYVAGTSRSHEDRGRGARQDLVVLAYEPDGTLRWERRRFGAVFPSYLEVAFDSARGRLHVLAEPAIIQQPMQLFAFDRRGRTRFVRTWRDRSSSYESAVAVTPKGDVLAVSAGGSHASLRAYSPSGRLRTARPVRIAARGDDGLPKVVIDPARTSAHVLNDSSEDRGATVRTFRFTGRRIASVLVDPHPDAYTASIALHDATGSVFAATNPWPEGPDRLVALRP